MNLFQGIRYFLHTEDVSKKKVLEGIFGFRIKNIKLYEQAFTHKSILRESKEPIVSNERLEFLGDAVYGAIISEYFFLRFPNKEEGYLTKMRSRLVSRQFLNQLSIDIGLDSFLETTADLNRAKSIFGDTFEALIGAIYIDRGYEATKKFVLKRIIPEYIDIAEVIKQETDFKSKLLQWCHIQNKNFDFTFKEINEGTSIYFNCELLINNKVVAKANERTKKKAEQKASQLFFNELEE